MARFTIKNPKINRPVMVDYTIDPVGAVHDKNATHIKLTGKVDGIPNIVDLSFSIRDLARAGLGILDVLPPEASEEEEEA